MFTGIITDVGAVVSVRQLDEGLRFRIGRLRSGDHRDRRLDLLRRRMPDGRGAAADAGSNARWFEVEAWEEALRLTTVSGWTPGHASISNASLKIGDELGGHIVSGHVDGMAEIVDRKAEGEAVRFTLEAPRELAKFIAPKGSVALDGTSLTVNRVDGIALRRAADPAFARRDHLGRAQRWRAHKPRDRHHGSLRGPARRGRRSRLTSTTARGRASRIRRARPAPGRRRPSRRSPSRSI